MKCDQLTLLKRLFGDLSQAALVFWQGGVQSVICGFVGLGIVITLLVPPFQVPDEPVHWLSAYSRTILSNYFTDEWSNCSIAASLPHAFEPGRIAFQANQKIKARNFKAVKNLEQSCNPYNLNYGHVGTYPGVVLARLLTRDEEHSGEKILQVFILGRLLQGMLLACLLWRFISLAASTGAFVPGLLTMCVAMLGPLAVQQSFGISADGVTFAGVICALYFMLFFAQVRWIDWIALMFLCVTCGATKPPVVGIMVLLLYRGLYLHIRESGFNVSRALFSRKAWGVHFCCMIVVGSALWIVSAQPTVSGPHPTGANVHLGDQVRYILGNPENAIALLARTTADYALSWQPMLGHLGWLNCGLSEWTQGSLQRLVWFAVVVEGIIAIWFAWGSSNGRQVVKGVLARLPWLVCEMSFLFISAMSVTVLIFLTWTAVGSDRVMGLQPRYFLPFLLPIPILMGYWLLGGPKIQSERNINLASASVISRVLFGLLSISMLSPLYLDLIKRWW